jgi:hypothetical protein
MVYPRFPAISHNNTECSLQSCMWPVCLLPSGCPAHPPTIHASCAGAITSPHTFFQFVTHLQSLEVAGHPCRLGPVLHRCHQRHIGLLAGPGISLACCLLGCLDAIQDGCSSGLQRGETSRGQDEKVGGWVTGKSQETLGWADGSGYSGDMQDGDSQEVVLGVGAPQMQARPSRRRGLCIRVHQSHTAHTKEAVSA